MTTSGPYCGEDYRNYLITLARIQLAGAGPLVRKIDCDDLVQAVLLQAHLAADQFHGTCAEQYSAWLRQILANKLTDAQRYYGRKKRDAAMEATYLETLDDSASRIAQVPIAQRTSASQYIAREQWGLRLANSLQQLPEDQRIAVELHYIGEYALHDIATKMQRSKPSVAGLLRRGLQALRDDLGTSAP